MDPEWIDSEWSSSQQGRVDIGVSVLSIVGWMVLLLLYWSLRVIKIMTLSMNGPPSRYFVVVFVSE